MQQQQQQQQQTVAQATGSGAIQTSAETLLQAGGVQLTAPSATGLQQVRSQQPQQVTWAVQQQQGQGQGRIQLGVGGVQVTTGGVGGASQLQQQQLLIVPQRAQQPAVTVLGGNLVLQQQQQPVRAVTQQQATALAAVRQIRAAGVAAAQQRPPQVVATGGTMGTVVPGRTGTVLVPLGLSSNPGQGILLRMPSGTDANSLRLQIQPQQQQQQHGPSSTLAANTATLAANASVGLVLPADDVMPLTPQEQLSKYVDNL